MNAKETLTTIAKMFGQGVPFAFLSFIAALVWARFSTMFTGLNGWLALIGMMVVLALGWGLLNLLMMYALWFPVERGWKSFLPQGLVLLAIFFPVGVLPLHFLIPPLANLGYVAYVAGFVVLNVFYAFPDGWISMKLGAHWKVRGLPTMAEDYVAFTTEPEILPDNPGGLHCPRCGSTKMVVAKDRSGYCIDCRKGIRSEKLGGALG